MLPPCRHSLHTQAPSVSKQYALVGLAQCGHVRLSSKAPGAFKVDFSLQYNTQITAAELKNFCTRPYQQLRSPSRPCPCPSEGDHCPDR